MKEKICTICLKAKSLSDFSIRRDRPSGYCSACKECSAEKKRLSRLGDLEQANLKRRSYYHNNKAKANAYRKTSLFRSNRNTKIRNDRLANPGKYRQLDRDRYRVNSKRVITRNGEYAKRRKKVDPVFRIITNIRRHLHHVVIQGKTRMVKSYGCTPEELRKHIESKFVNGMSWDSYGRKGWHIDHIRPLSSVDWSDEKDILSVMHYSNLQPLWAEDNIRKSNKYEHQSIRR